MNEQELKKTRQKLTLQFVGVVFLIAVFLEVLFFSFRFLNEQRRSEQGFISGTQQILATINGRQDILDFFDFGIDEKMDGGFIEKRRGKNLPLESLISYIIINSQNEVIEKSIKENIDFGILLEDHGTGVYLEDQTWIRKEKIEWLYEPATVYFYKVLPYSLEDYFSDIALFTLLTLLLSIGFYFIGYKFVSQTLRPVEDNLRDMSDFIHNAGHELKTPLAVMRGNIQIMQAEKKFDDTLLSQSIREVDRLNNLIEGLIELSETGKSTHRENFALATEVAKIVKQLQLLADESGVTLENTVSGKFIVYTSREELAVLLSNIIKNAIKYNTKNGSVKISFQKGVLSITDTGIGISESDGEKIFERFYQGKSARTGEGFGIGLSLVKKIADVNGWKVQVESKKEKGTTFKIIF